MLLIILYADFSVDSASGEIWDLKYTGNPFRDIHIGIIFYIAEMRIENSIKMSNNIQDAYLKKLTKLVPCPAKPEVG